jgi:type III pantothenate kinase
MLLAIDIGNSSIGLGLFDGETLTFTAKLSADTKRCADEYAVIIRGLLSAQGISPASVTAVAISSVVPKLTHTIENALAWRDVPAPIPVLTVGGGVKTGISLKVDDPATLGADIVTNAAAAVRQYGVPVLIVDVGTATVISCVSEQKALVGVAIAPGPISAQEGLHKSAALIPDAELSRSAGVLGKNTPAALRSGLVTGHACMIDGMIARIREEYRLPAATPVVITGGLAPLVTAECRQPMTYEKDLTLMGLYYIYTATAAAKAKR